VAMGESEPAQEFEPVPASGRPASGGVPHEPIPAPAEMTEARPTLPAPAAAASEPGEPVPSVDENEPAVGVGAGYIAASGLAPRAEGWVAVDPEVERDRAWAEATSSPAVVTGQVV